MEIECDFQNFGLGVVLQTLQVGGQAYADVLLPVRTTEDLSRRGAEPVLVLMNGVRAVPEPASDFVL